jgi:hypothetical protein
LIISPNDARFGTAKPKFFNDLDLDNDVIYFVDSSYERNVSEVLEEHIEALPRGRLFRFVINKSIFFAFLKYATIF